MLTPESIDRFELLTLQLDTEIVAVDAIHVREILDQIAVTRVPGAPAFVNGLINVRGQVIPLADLRLKLGLEIRPPTQDSRIIVMEAELEGEVVTIGVRADKVFEVTELSSDEIESAPRIGLRWRPEHIRFVGKRDEDLIIALNIDRILSDDPPPRGPTRDPHQSHEHAAASADPAIQ